MNTEELAVKLKELESQIKKLQTLQDIEDIKKLQKAYGYYLMNWMHEELIECFADNPDTILEWPQGTFLGKDGARRFFGNINKDKDPEFMHQMMQVSGIVNLEPDITRAKGRWWGFGAMAIPAGSMEIPGGEGVDQAIACGIYEMGYLKENDVWKILKIKWVPVFSGAPGKGWVKPERRSQGRPSSDTSGGFPEEWKPDGPPAGINYSYPSGYILPFHYKHPVTGKETTEAMRNTNVK
ncbi:nuclear transport factor 2 family protein [Chloroflexota bacterium]